MKLWQAMLRLEMHHGDGKSSTELWRWRWEKQREKEKKNGGDADVITRPGSKEKPRRSLPRASAKLRTATRAPRTEKKAASDEVASTGTVPHIYRIAIRQNLQITPKFM